MSVVINIGRRAPKSWFRRQGGKVMGFISFQENLWMMIKQSMALAKKKANASGKIKFVMTNEKEDEDMHYDIQWLKIIIQGTEEQEKEEYEEALQFYSPLDKIFKKEMPKDEQMKKHFKTKMLDHIKVEEAYKQGYGALSDNNLANKMLEMGILTHIEWIKDFNTRDVEIKTDF